MEKKNINKVIKELKECLDSLTLKELANDKEIQKSLSEASVLINDFFMMINPKKRCLFIKEDE